MLDSLPDGNKQACRECSTISFYVPRVPPGFREEHLLRRVAEVEQLAIKAKEVYQYASESQLYINQDPLDQPLAKPKSGVIIGVQDIIKTYENN